MNNDSTKWIDISLPVYNGMLRWPGDPPIKISRVMDLESGDAYTLSRISFGSHTGTHVDAPLHYIKGGMSVDNLNLSIINGKARVIEIKNESLIDKAELMEHDIQSGQRILFKTRNSGILSSSGKFNKDFVFLSEEAAKYLVRRRVGMVGIDYLSIESLKNSTGDIHRILLEAGIWVVEGLNLSEVLPGEYELLCLPLRILYGDAAPARAVLRFREENTGTKE